MPAPPLGSVPAIESATEELTEELSRPPSPKELAEHLQIDLSDVLETLAAEAPLEPVDIASPDQDDAAPGQ